MSNRSNINLIGNSTTAQNLGSGAGIFAGKNNANNLQFKSISATGTSIQIFNCNNQIYISGSTGGGGGTGATTVCVDILNNIYSCNTLFDTLTTGSNNLALGTNTLNSITSGSNNIVVGFGGLSSTDIGYNNIALGYDTLPSNTCGCSNIAIGCNTLFSNITGCENIANGSNSLYLNTTGNNNIAIGQCAGYNETGSNKLYIANNADKSLIYGEFDNEKLCVRGKLYVSGLTNSCNSNLIYYNNSTKELTYGVSCYLPLTGGTVSGCITAINFILSSDERLKENISSISHSEIDKVNLVQFNFKCDETKHLRYGVVAQDLEKVHPEMVFENYDGYKEVAYIDFLVAKINSLENRLITLESKIL